jgi:hypothetical protein
MPPPLIYEGSAVVDINVPYVNIGPSMIDPARAVPAVINHVVVAPVKVHAQPVPDHQAKAKGDEWRETRGRSLNIDD